MTKYPTKGACSEMALPNNRRPLDAEGNPLCYRGHPVVGDNAKRNRINGRVYLQCRRCYNDSVRESMRRRSERPENAAQ